MEKTPIDPADRESKEPLREKMKNIFSLVLQKPHMKSLAKATYDFLSKKNV